MRRREYLTNIGKIKLSGAIRHTFATTFLLPTIGYCEKEFNNNLINVHIGSDLTDPSLILIIDLVYDIQESINRLKLNPIYLGHELTEHEAIIKFKIPHIFHNIFYRFIDGKYSEFDNEYKQILTNIYGIKVIHSGTLVSVYDTLYPRKDKIKQIAEDLGVDKELIREVFDKPDLNYEIYQSIEQLKETII